MPPSSSSASAAATTTTNTRWNHEYDTLRREALFRHPPTDHTAYPALQAAVNPHIESFNAILQDGGLLAHALDDIGTREYLDVENPSDGETPNRLRLRIKEIFVSRSTLSANNKYSAKNRDIFPAECRERHCTYRGKLMATLEYQVNDGDIRQFHRDLGQLPLMVKVTLLPYGLVMVRLIRIVKSMSLGGLVASTTRREKGRGRRTWWLLCLQWH